MSGRTARVLVGLIGLYQKARRTPSPCRYYPSCSEYAREAIESHGAARGSWLALRRLGRCQPFGGHGYDPVPERAVPADHRSTSREIRWHP